MSKEKIIKLCSLLIITTIISLLTPTLSFGSLQDNTYGGTGFERFNSIQYLNPLGFVMAGWTTSFSSPADTNVLIVPVDSAGVPLRPALISTGQGADVATSIAHFQGGYIVTGWTRSCNGGATGSDIFVCKLDVHCNFLWGRVYIASSDDQAYSIIVTHEGGLAVCGWTTSFGPNPQIFVLRLDQQGNILWSNVYQSMVNPMGDEGYGITEIVGIPDFPLAVVGKTRKTEAGRTTDDAFIMWLDSMGNTFNNPPIISNNNTAVLTGYFHDDEARAVVSNGPWATVAGFTKNYYFSHDDSSANIFIAKFPPMPPLLYTQPIWSRFYGWDNGDEKVIGDKSFILDNVPGSEYALGGLTYNKGPGTPNNPNFLMMSLDANGGILWSRVHPSKPGALAEEAYSITKTPSMTYGAGGFTNSFGLGGDDFSLVALDPQGNRPVCVLPVKPDTGPCFWHNDSMVMGSAQFSSDNFELVDTMVNYTYICRTSNRWTLKDSVPKPIIVLNKHVKDGGFLVTGHRDTLFAFRGNRSNEFYRFVIGPDTWTLPLPQYSIESIPFTGKVVADTYLITPQKKYPSKGAALCFDGDSIIYATRGGGTREFWAYNINQNKWRTKRPLPTIKGIKGGTSMVFYNDTLYLLAGSVPKPCSNNFFAYNPGADTTHGSPWRALAILDSGPYKKTWKDGSCLTLLDGSIYALKGNDKQGYFYRYDAPSWTELESIPIPDTVKIDITRTPPKITLKKLAPKDGGAMAAGNGMIYTIKGGGSWALWEYTPGSGWSQSIYDTIPRLNSKSYAKTGAGLVYANDALWLMKGNNTPEFWKYTVAYGGKSASNSQWSNLVMTNQSAAAVNVLPLFDIGPNPFTTNTTIRYTVPVTGKVTLKLYNATGRLIETLLDDYKTAGSYTLNIDNSKLNISKGVYFLRYENSTDKSEIKLIVQ